MVYGVQNAESLVSLLLFNLCRQDLNVISGKTSWSFRGPCSYQVELSRSSSTSICIDDLSVNDYHKPRTWILADSIVISWLSFLTYCIVAWLIYVALFWLVVYCGELFVQVQVIQAYTWYQYVHVHATQCTTSCSEIYTSIFEAK